MFILFSFTLFAFMEPALVYIYNLVCGGGHKVYRFTLRNINYKV